MKVRSLETIKGFFEHALLQLSGFNSGPLHSSKNRMFNIKLVLPKGLTCGKAKYLGNLFACDQCAMQWWWTVGDNWGCNDDGVSVRERLGSVDIKIKLGGGPLSTGAPYTNDLFTESPYTQSPSRAPLQRIP